MEYEISAITYESKSGYQTFEDDSTLEEKKILIVDSDTFSLNAMKTMIEIF